MTLEQIARKHATMDLSPQATSFLVWNEPAVLAALRELREELARVCDKRAEFRASQDDAAMTQEADCCAAAIRRYGEEESMSDDLSQPYADPVVPSVATTGTSQAEHEAAVRTVRECFIHAEAKPLSIWAEQHRYVANMADAALVYKAERDHARACYEAQTRLLSDILGALPPPDVTADGETYRFNPPPACAMSMLREFQAAINTAIEQARKGSSIMPQPPPSAPHPEQP